MDRTVEELQNDLIEAQRHIISAIMGLYCTEPVFELPDHLQSEIRKANSLYQELTTP